MRLGLYNYGAKEIFINLQDLSSPPSRAIARGCGHRSRGGSTVWREHLCDRDERSANKLYIWVLSPNCSAIIEHQGSVAFKHHLTSNHGKTH